MTKTKIHLSKQEYEMMIDPGFILTKNEVMKKMRTYLEELQVYQQAFLEKQHPFPDEVMQVTPKISRGENYLGLPWLVLDNPRYFGQMHICAIRTMFWWGNFFSTTLHLNGKFKDQFQDKIISNYTTLGKTGFSVCVSENEWQHHFEESNYRLISDMRPAEFTEQLAKRNFLKIAVKLPLTRMEESDEKLIEQYKVLAGSCL